MWAARPRLLPVYLTYTCGLAAAYGLLSRWLVGVAHFNATQIASVSALLCVLLVLASVCAGGTSSESGTAAPSPLRWYAVGSALAIAGVALEAGELGLAAIILCGVPFTGGEAKNYA